jgi:hypothetical protein
MVQLFAASKAVTSGRRWDRTGIALSAACAVHCTVLPVVAGLLPFLGLQHFADKRLEWLIVAMTACIGFVGHGRAYLHHHRHIGPGILFLAGLGTIIVTRLGGAGSVIEPVALGLGGLSAAGAHWMNLRLCRCCDACAGNEDLPIVAARRL